MKEHGALAKADHVFRTRVLEGAGGTGIWARGSWEKKTGKERGPEPGAGLLLSSTCFSSVWQRREDVGSGPGQETSQL